MKKLLITLIFLSLFLSGCSNNNLTYNQEESNSYSVSRITATDNASNVNTTNASENNETNNINTETELSSFSTKIYTPDDEARQTNIKITSSKLNGTIVKSRRNFFFL